MRNLKSKNRYASDWYRGYKEELSWHGFTLREHNSKADAYEGGKRTARLVAAVPLMRRS